MPANSAFLQGWLEPLLGRWLYADSPLWTVVGFLGAAIFGSRFILQWLQTEKEKKLVVPWHFWHLSFWGSLLNLLYFMHLDKAPLILGNCFLPFLYGRNILFLRKEGAKGQGRKVFALVALLMVGGFVWSVVMDNEGASTAQSFEEKAASQMSKATKAFEQYRSTHDAPPKGSSKDIFKQLDATSSIASGDVSPEGDWLDPWGKPYRIFVNLDSILVQSAGKDGVFNDRNGSADDIQATSKL